VALPEVAAAQHAAIGRHRALAIEFDVAARARLLIHVHVRFGARAHVEPAHLKP
jgi:hypothetical protein